MSRNNSTNVRKPVGEPSAPWAARAAFRVLGALAPGLAGRAAEQLFLTPPRHRTPERERAALESARAFDVPFRGGRLGAWRWGGEGSPVLLVHGWGGRGGQMAPFAPPLLEHGLPVVTFDGPAHGRSDGRLSSAPDFAEAIRAVAAHLGGVQAVIAHSMGAPATVLALRDGLAVDGAVFVGGSVGPGSFLRLFARALGLTEAVYAAMVRRLEARFGRGFERFDARDECAAMNVPLLVIHDRDDAEVAWEEGRAIAAAWPRAELVTTTGLGHRRILRDAAVVGRVTSFVAAGPAAGRAPVAAIPRASSGSARCATPGCPGRRSASWADGRFCPTCALSHDLFDRSARQARLARA